MSSHEYKSYTLKVKKDYIEVSQNGKFFMNVDTINEAKKEIDELEKND